MMGQKFRFFSEGGKHYLLHLFLFLFPLLIQAQSVSFRFTTQTDNGTFSPKHVLAVWVEDANGNFVKSLKVMAAKRIQYLYSWNAKSGANKLDAVTGATLSSHQAHTINWNCKDLSQNVVADGEYKLVVEFTDQHAQGPKYSVNFTKGSSNQKLTPANQSYFKSISLDYTAPVVSGISTALQKFKLYPNPAHERFTLVSQLSAVENLSLRILDITGKEVQQEELPLSEERSWTIDVSKLPRGLYFVEVSNSRQKFSQRLLIR